MGRFLMRAGGLLAMGMVLAGPAVAQMAVGHDPVRAHAEAAALAIDLDRDGALSQGELMTFGAIVHESIDADNSGGISVEEVLTWPHGLAELAAYRDRSDLYEAEAMAMHRLLDQDGDGSITRPEHLAGMLVSAEEADADGDAVLTRAEYVRGFFYTVAIRAAFAPQM